MIPVVNLGREQVIDYLKNVNSSTVYYDIILPFDEFSLIKIYYKKAYEICHHCDSKSFDEKIEASKKTKLTEFDSESSKKYKLLLNRLYKMGIIKKVVFYNDFLIGIIVNNYKDYCTIGSIYGQLDISDRIIVLQKIRTFLESLMDNNIYPDIFNEDNILVRKSNFDINAINLDDTARYKQKEDVLIHPYIRYHCINSYNNMRLKLIRDS